MRTLAALFLFAHGIAHVVGFAVPWRLIHSPDLPYKTTIAGGLLDLGDVGIRAFALLWLVLAAAFAWTGALLLLRSTWFQPAVLSVVAASALMCLVNLPAARIGLAVNAVVLLAVLISARSA